MPRRCARQSLTESTSRSVRTRTTRAQGRLAGVDIPLPPLRDDVIRATYGMSELTDDRSSHLAEAGRALHLIEKLLSAVRPAASERPSAVGVIFMFFACVLWQGIAVVFLRTLPLVAYSTVIVAWLAFWWVFTDWRVQVGVHRTIEKLSDRLSREVTRRRDAIADELKLE